MRITMPTALRRHLFVRSLGAALGGLASAALLSTTAVAAEKVTFLTSWFAQAEHGGFYQAKATGLYEKAGLDVTIKMGGPQVNGMQLLLAGETDVMMGYDLQVLKALEQGFPVTTIATSFQHDLQGMMTHDDVAKPRRPEGQDHPGRHARAAQPGGRGSRPSTSTPTSRPSPTPSICSPSSPTRTSRSRPIRRPSRSRPSSRECRSSSSCSRATAIRPMAPPWSPPAHFADKNQDVAARFVKASLEGWKSYIADPAPAQRADQGGQHRK